MVGGLGNHVFYLARELAKLHDEVVVLTLAQGEQSVEHQQNIRIHRVVPYKLDEQDFSKWIMHMNFAMIEEGVKSATGSSYDVIHCHDWLCAYSAKALGSILNVPVVCTIHSTEHGRNNGIWTDLQRYIHSVELLLTEVADELIVCSTFMQQHVIEVLDAPEQKLHVIANGIDAEEALTPEIDSTQLAVFRRRLAPNEEKVIFYIGRHVYEKGVHLLVQAMTGVLAGCPQAKLVLAGVGPMTQTLKEQVRTLSLEENVEFLGFTDEETKRMLFQVSDVAVFPSLFEPFGIVALEAMANSCPVIVSDTGGFSEIVRHGKNGLKADVGSVQSIMEQILELLGDESLGQRLTEQAHIDIATEYSWTDICRRTREIYHKAISNHP